MFCHIYLEDRRNKPYVTTDDEYSMVTEPIEGYGRSK